MRPSLLLLVSLLLASIATAADPKATPVKAAATPKGMAFPAASKAAATPAGNAEMLAWMAKVDAQFREPYEREVLKPYEAGKNELKQKYLAILTPMINAAAESARVDESDFLRKERQRIFDGNGVPPDDADKPPAAIATARAAFRLPMAKLDQEHARGAKLHCDRFDKYLADAQATLAQRGRLEDVALVKAKREEIAPWVPAPVATAAAPVVLKATPIPAPPVATTNAAILEVAAWLIESGAEVSTYDGKKNVRLTSAGALSGGRVPVTSVVVDGLKLTAPIKPEELSRLGSLKALRHLEIRGGLAVNDETMAFVGHLEELELLTIYGSQCSDLLLEALAGRARLKELKIHNAKQLTGKALERLAEARELKTLDLEECPVADENILQLLKLTHLEKLMLDRTKITDVALVTIGKLGSLTDLGFARTGVTPKGLASLKGLRKLEHLGYLEANMPDFNEAIREATATFPKLASWRLNGNPISAEAIQTLGQIKSMDRLVLSGKLAPGALAVLSSMPAVDKLVLMNGERTDAELEPLTSLRWLKVLDAGGKGITDDFLEKMKRCRGLKELKLTTSSITPQGIAAFEKQVPGCKVTK